MTYLFDLGQTDIRGHMAFEKLWLWRLNKILPNSDNLNLPRHATRCVMRQRTAA